MRRFLLELSACLVIAFVTTWSLAVRRWESGGFLDRINNPEVFRAARKCQSRFDAKTLVLGDSVAIQLFNNQVEGIDPTSLATNGGVTLAGQYVMLRQAIRANPQLEQVILILHPLSFRMELRNPFSYHLFVKPFYRKPFLEDFTPTARRQVESLPLSWLAVVPQVRISNWSPYAPRRELESATDVLVTFNREFLEKMIQLTNEHGIELQILSPPLDRQHQDIVQKLAAETDPEDPSSEILQRYLASVFYVDASEFCDGVHLNQPIKFVPQYDHYMKPDLVAEHWNVESQACRCDD